MTYEELIERVTWGEEFSFKYNNEQYWISQNKDGRYLTRVSDSYTQKFKTTKELFEKGKIEGKSIFEIWDSICKQF